jgi:glucosylglycerate synthase
VEAESIPQQVEEKPEMESADLVVGVLADLEPNSVSMMCDSLRGLQAPLKIAVLQKERHEGAVAANPQGAETSASPDTPSRTTVFQVPWPLTKPESTTSGALSMFAAYQAVFVAADKLQARACCIMASKLENMTPQTVCQLAQPLFEGEVDLVLPHYEPRMFEGLLNNSILAPLIRTLYGKRVNNPLGPDFALSRRLLQRMLTTKTGSTDGSRLHPLASLTPAALCENLHIMEVRFSSRIYPPTDWSNMSSILADVLTPVFLDMERNAPCWQRTRISTPLPSVGASPPHGHDSGTVDTNRLIESFQLGTRELQEIWGLVLPPSTLFELRKLSRLPADQFRMPDELWVRIVYDFALAHRLRTISRDHLLRSLTPLYLGWVASYARDLQTSGASSPERRLEQLGVAYEAEKSYLVSRWRWPDRFNP